MKILQLCNRVPYPLIDGGAIAMFAMTKSLSDAGCEVHMLAINTKKHFVEIDELPEWFNAKVKLHTVDANTDVTPHGAIINLFSTKSYNLVRFDIPEFHKKLAQLLTEHKYDVVQLEGLFLSMYIATIRKHSTALVSMRGHNVEYLIWERLAASTGSFFKKKYLQLLAKRLKREEISALQELDCIVPISEVDAQLYQQQGAKVPMLVCTAGVDDSLLKAKPVEIKKNTLFHLAAMNWQPNVEALNWLMQSIWPKVKISIPEAHLYLAGKDMPDSMIKHSSTRVTVCGKVNDAVQFMQDKQIMLVPLLSGSGMRIKIIEGMALGKVIISTSIGAEGIDCSSGKNILLADTAAEFSNQIALALSNSQLCDEISKNAKALVQQKYTNSSIISDLISFYRNLLK